MLFELELIGKHSLRIYTFEPMTSPSTPSYGGGDAIFDIAKEFTLT